MSNCVQNTCHPCPLLYSASPNPTGDPGQLIYNSVTDELKRFNKCGVAVPLTSPFPMFLVRKGTTVTLRNLWPGWAVKDNIVPVPPTGATEQFVILTNGDIEIDGYLPVL